MSSHMPVINDTVIGKLNPITKIAAVFALGLSALAWPDFTLGLILVVLLLVVSFLAHIQRDFAKIMFGFGIPVTVMLMFIQGLYSPKNRTALLDFGPIGTFVVLITVARPCGSRRVGLSFLSRGK